LADPVSQAIQDLERLPSLEPSLALADPVSQAILVSERLPSPEHHQILALADPVFQAISQALVDPVFQAIQDLERLPSLEPSKALGAQEYLAILVSERRPSLALADPVFQAISQALVDPVFQAIQDLERLPSLEPSKALGAKEYLVTLVLERLPSLEPSKASVDLGCQAIQDLERPPINHSQGLGVQEYLAIQAWELRLNLERINQALADLVYLVILVLEHHLNLEQISQDSVQEYPATLDLAHHLNQD
jgi:hypothetical protein